jgi:hypothetical protein
MDTDLFLVVEANIIRNVIDWGSGIKGISFPPFQIPGLRKLLLSEVTAFFS